MKTLSKENYGRPTYPEIEINPEKWGNTKEPQACEHNGNWFYNYEGAMKEAEYRNERIPTIDELLEIINSIPWDCKEKAKALNIPFAGCRDADGGEFHGEGDFSDLWSSSPGGEVGAHYACLGRGSADAARGWGYRVHGMSLRLFVDTSDSSSLTSLENSSMEIVIKVLKKQKSEYESKAQDIQTAIDLLRNLQ